jgi:hypothetical protein
MVDCLLVTAWVKLTYCNDFAIYVFNRQVHHLILILKIRILVIFQPISMYLPLSASSEIPIKINAFLDIGYNFIFNGYGCGKLFEGQFFILLFITD